MATGLDRHGSMAEQSADDEIVFKDSGVAGLSPGQRSAADLHKYRPVHSRKTPDRSAGRGRGRGQPIKFDGDLTPFVLDRFSGLTSSTVSQKSVRGECTEYSTLSSRGDGSLQEGKSCDSHVTLQNTEAKDTEKRGRSAVLGAIRPDYFDGTSDFAEYEIHFKACAKINGWDDHSKLQVMLARLKGVALRVASTSLGQGSDLTFDRLCELLREQFGSGGQEDAYRLAIRNIHRQPGQSLRDLAQLVRETVWKAYPEARGEMRERLCIEAYFDAVGEETIKRKINETGRSPKAKLEDCVKAAVAEENYLSLCGKGKVTGHRSVGGKAAEIDGEVSDLRSLIEQLVVDVADLKKERARVPSVKSGCWLCGQSGHIRKNCPNKSKKVVNAPENKSQVLNTTGLNKRVVVQPGNSL